MKLKTMSWVKGAAALVLGGGLWVASWEVLASHDVSPPPGQAASAAAVGGPRGPEHAPLSASEVAAMHKRMADRLGQAWKLDAEQQQRLTVLLTRMHEQREAARPEGDPRSVMDALVAGHRFDVAKAQALADARADALRKSSPPVIQAAAAFYDGLKPEQQMQVRGFLAQSVLPPAPGHRPHGEPGLEPGGPRGHHGGPGRPDERDGGREGAPPAQHGQAQGDRAPGG